MMYFNSQITQQLTPSTLIALPSFVTRYFLYKSAQ